jgi:hypothetical protein
MILFPQISHPQDISASPAGKLLAAVEELGYCRQQLALRGEGDTVQNETIALTEQKVKFLEEKIALYIEMIAMQKEFDLKKDALHQKEIEAVKPTLWDNTKIFLGGMGTAALIIVIIAAL